MNGTAQCLWMVQSMPFSFSFPSFLFFSDNLAWAPSNILCSLLQKCCILAGVITDTHSYHFEQKAVHINRRYLVPMLNLQCAQIKIILISPMCEFHRRNKFDQDTIHMQLGASFMSSLKMYFPPDINNIVLWRERKREEP